MKFIFGDGSEIDIILPKEIIEESKFLSSFDEMEDDVIVPCINLHTKKILTAKNYFSTLLEGSDDEMISSFYEKVSFFDFIGCDYLIVKIFTKIVLHFYEKNYLETSRKFGIFSEDSFGSAKLWIKYITSSLLSKDLEYKLNTIITFEKKEEYFYEKVFFHLSCLFKFQRLSLTLTPFSSKEKKIILNKNQSREILSIVFDGLRRWECHEFPQDTILFLFDVLDEESVPILKKEFMRWAVLNFNSKSNIAKRSFFIGSRSVSTIDKETFIGWLIFGKEVIVEIEPLYKKSLIVVCKEFGTFNTVYGEHNIEEKILMEMMFFFSDVKLFPYDHPIREGNRRDDIIIGKNKVIPLGKLRR